MSEVWQGHFWLGFWECWTIQTAVTFEYLQITVRDEMRNVKFMGSPSLAKSLRCSTAFPSFLQGQNDWAKHGVDFSNSTPTISIIAVDFSNLANDFSPKNPSPRGSLGLQLSVSPISSPSTWAMCRHLGATCKALRVRCSSQSKWKPGEVVKILLQVWDNHTVYYAHVHRYIQGVIKICCSPQWSSAI